MSIKNKINEKIDILLIEKVKEKLLNDSEIDITYEDFIDTTKDIITEYSCKRFITHMLFNESVFMQAYKILFKRIWRDMISLVRSIISVVLIPVLGPVIVYMIYKRLENLCNDTKPDSFRVK